MDDEAQKSEPAEILIARNYVAESFARCMAELKSDDFIQVQSPENERGGLTSDSIRAALASVAEAGLEDFEAKISTAEGRISELVIFERRQENGTFIEIRCERPTAADTDEIVARSIFVTVKDEGKTQEIPDSILHLANVETRDGGSRIASIIIYDVSTYLPNGSKTLENMRSQELRMANTSVVRYSNGSGN